MKDFRLIATTCAMALAGTLAFTACSSEEDMADVNPTFDGTSVKTDFAISIPYGGNATRMSADITQDSKNFRGMTNIKLIPTSFFVQNDNSGVDFNHKLIALGDLVSYRSDNSQGIDNDETQPQSSHIYKDKTIAVGTSNFLFYGEAKPDNTLKTVAQKHSNGIVTSSFSEKTDDGIQRSTDIYFKLNPIVSTDDDWTKYKDAKTALLKILNDVKDAGYWESNVTSHYPYGTPDYDESDNLVYYDDHDNRWLGLAELYYEFTKNKEVRAGSASAIMETLNMLYDNVWLLRSKVNSNPDTEVQDVADVCTAILKAIVGSSSDYEKSGDNFKATEVKGWNEYDEDPSAPGHLKRHFTLAWAIKDKTITNFPAEFGLPEGVAQLSFDSDFEYYDNDDIAFGKDEHNDIDRIDVTKIAYPTSLYYFANSPLKATNVEIKEDRKNNSDASNKTTWPTSVNGWDKDDYWSDNSTNWIDVVRSNTRSIAMRNNVHYGVSRLAVTVRCKADTDHDNSLLDNSSKNTISGENGGGTPEDLYVKVPDGGFPLNGILVGGQPKMAAWNFLPATTDAGYESEDVDNEYVVYDNTMNGTITAKYGDDKSAVNYTMLLDNYDYSEAKPVNIVLEFTNNSDVDFYGVNGLVRKGQKFYLIGRLNPNSSANPSSGWSTGTYADRFPANNKMRAFIQDYTTTANFTIKDLRNAYVTIPDLRIAQLQFGISVDLEWRNGVEYEIDL